MPRVHLRLPVETFVLLSLIFSVTFVTMAQRSAIDIYAITNARIVTVSGPVIERGTVVIRDGLIMAVGANISAPADARVIDGTGLTVYPGLIDASTSLGIPEASSAAPTPAGVGAPVAVSIRPAGPAASGTNSTQPPGLQPEVLAENLIQTGGNQIDSARNAGITAALTAPRSGIWMGQSALINLAGDTPQQMIVRSPIAMHVGFTPLRGTYPGSLLGVFATLRQMLLDAQRYRDARLIYERSPRGVRRPSQDRSLEALIPVLEGRMPVVFYADREREIRRALDFADEFKLKALIAGGGESWKVTDRLQKSDVAVLLSLNFPRRTTAAMPQADPEPLRVLRDRVDMPKTAAKLALAKVRFAFQSGAMTSISDFLPNAGKTIENGLLKDDAIRALTIRPAEIFGVADRLGSIEAGKIANLTVVRGDLFERNTRIVHVFIDGRPVDLRPAPAAPGQMPGAAGTWTINVNLGGPQLGATLILSQEGNQIRGSMQGALGNSDIANASVSASGEIRFTAPVTVEGQTTEATFSGTITGNEMRGVVNITGRSPGSFTGARPAASAQPSQSSTRAEPMPAETSADFSGTWSISISINNQTIPGTLTLIKQNGMVSGTLETGVANAQFSGGSIEGNGFRASTSAIIEGQTIDLTIQGNATGNEISGTINSQLGLATFSGRRPGSTQ